MAGAELKDMAPPHDANKRPEYGYGKTPDVVTQLEALATFYKLFIKK